MERTELRPDFAQYLRWFRTNLVVVSGLAALQVIIIGVNLRQVSTSGSGFVFLAGFTLVFLGLLVGWVLGTIATSRVILEPGSVTYRRWGVLVTRFEVGGDLRGLLAGKTATGASVEFLIMRRGRRGAKIKLNGGFWDTDDLATIARHAGVTVDTDSTLTPAQWQKRVPGLIPWWERHQVATGLIFGFGIIFAVVGGVTAVFVANDLPPFDSQPPKSILAADNAREDALLARVAAVFGTVDPPSESSFEECTDTKAAKGWRRHLTLHVLPADGATPTTTISDDAQSRVDDILGSEGFAELHDSYGDGTDFRSFPSNHERRDDALEVETTTDGYDVAYSEDCVTPQNALVAAPGD